MAAPAVARPHRTAAAHPVSAVSVGRAVTEVASEGFAGRVAGVFRGGFYVSGLSGTPFAVLGPRSWPGPLHLIAEDLAGLPTMHDRVSVSQDVLRAGRLQVRLDGAAPWAPRLPEHVHADLPAWRHLAECAAPELAAVWSPLIDDLRRADLVAAFGRLQGRGTGLTPSGDDVLAGILLVGAIDPARRRVLTDLAMGARTTRLSRAFLRWAASGQSIQPAHALLDAGAAGDQSGMRGAAESLAEVGATSGRALAAGIALGATELARRMVPRPNDVWRRAGDHPDAHL